MGIVAEEAYESYAPEAIVTLQSESTEDMKSNVERLSAWVTAWRQQRGLEP